MPDPHPLHLLRALLREASYLPDAVARSYFRRYIVSRFRAYQPGQDAVASPVVRSVEKQLHRSSSRRRHESIINERARAMLRKGRKALNYLRRANLGEGPCLQKILYFAYGRIGTRKHLLQERLLAPDSGLPGLVLPPSEPSPLQKLYHSNARCLSFFDAPKVRSESEYIIKISDRYPCLKTVLQTQVQKGLSLNRPIKTAAVIMPAKNVWQRPMPIKRARNKVRAWYAETMAALLPPLPDHEWDAIQQMIRGKQRISFVGRRVRAAELNPSSPNQTHGSLTLIQNALALDKPGRADGRARFNRPRALTSRYMRRLYAKVFVHCSKLVWNEKYNKWEAVWGNHPNGMNQWLNSEQLTRQLFAGLDAKGKPHTEKLPHTSNTSVDGKEQKPRREYTIIPFYIDYLPLDHPVRKQVDGFRQHRAAVQSERGA